MARKETTPKKTETINVPVGFRRLGSASAECWFALKTNNEMRGKLLGVYERDDPRNKVTGKSEFFQVELTKPAECRYGKGQKATFKIAPAGTLINLNCNTKTAVLKDLIPDMTRGAVYEVYVHCGEKIELNNGNTMWNMTTGANMLVAPKVVQGPDFSDGAGDGEDDGEAGSDDAQADS